MPGALATSVRRAMPALPLHAKLAAARTARARTGIARQIASTDRRIGKLVHALWGLTADEIAVVEKAAQRT